MVCNSDHGLFVFTCLILIASGFIILVFGILFYMHGIVTIIKYLLRYSLICLDMPVRETRRRWRLPSQRFIYVWSWHFQMHSKGNNQKETERKINAFELRILIIIL